MRVLPHVTVIFNYLWQHWEGCIVYPSVPLDDFFCDLTSDLIYALFMMKNNRNEVLTSVLSKTPFYNKYSV